MNQLPTYDQIIEQVKIHIKICSKAWETGICSDQFTYQCPTCKQKVTYTGEEILNNYANGSCQNCLVLLIH